VAPEKKTSYDEPKAKVAAKKTPAKPTVAEEQAAELVTNEAQKPRARRAARPKAEAPATKGGETVEVKPRRTRAKAGPKGAAPHAKKAAAEAPEAEAAEAPALKPRRRAAKKAAEEAPPAVKAERPPKAKKAAVAREPAHGELGKATIVDAQGKRVGTAALNEARFNVACKIDVLHLAVRAEQAARRRGSASSKTRGEVSGSTAKLYRQKGTGRARAGSAKSPTRMGGGTAFGPHPRTYDIKVNKKVARQARAMALSDRAAGGDLYVARGLELEQPSTARVNELLVNLDIAVPVLVVTNDEPAVAKSVRNLRYAEPAEASTLSTEQVLRARSLVLTEKAFAALNEA
jgi:large subunit ribosomal protein L4